MVKVSVIIPSYNHAKYLKERIDSILLQTFRDFELIILDDASTDNSREIIFKYIKSNPEIITCFNDQNSGSPFKQWNKGVSMAKGEYLWIAESDDFADPDFLQRTFTEILKSDETGLVYCDSWVLNEQKRIRYRFSDKMYLNLLTLKSFIRNPIPNVSSVLIRKSAYLEAGAAEITMKYCGDWFLYLKIRKSSEVTYIPDPLSTFRLHEHSRYHSHYKSGKYLVEKLTVYKYLIKQSSFSPRLLFLVMKSISASMAMRLLHILKFSPRLIPDLPRTARKVENY